MDEIQNYKCPCCGGVLVFSGAKQKLHCDSCGNDYEAETIKLVTEVEAQAQTQSRYEWESYTPRKFSMDDTSLAAYECPSCGASIQGDGSLGATICPYCGNTTIIKDKFEGAYMPDYIIPFRLEKKDAMSGFRASAAKKMFIPKAFKSESKIKDVTGLYVPFWMFDCGAEADITYNAERVSTWCDSKYNYTRTDYYKLYRSGTAEFENIPVDASLKAEDAYMDAIEPFDYSAAVKFDSSYLSGYLADKYDVSVEDSIERANRRVRSSMENMLKRDTTSYSSVTTQNSSVRFSGGKVRYAFMPVWMLNVKYREKNYKFAMNGQNGKSVGNYPASKGKIALLSAIAFAITLAIAMGVCGISIGWSLLISAIMTSIVAVLAIQSTRDVTTPANADMYAKTGSSRITKSEDFFLYSNVTRSARAEIKNKGR
ncbi:MAG: hypothetical protein J1G06_00725 [Oscillospiraceae bacterium]|nr:hypothetical protein [Oscillospiraceae bacterium]